jgi:hypothetical protein
VGRVEEHVPFLGDDDGRHEQCQPLTAARPIGPDRRRVVGRRVIAPGLRKSFARERLDRIVGELDPKAIRYPGLILRVDMDEQLERGERKVLGRVHEARAWSVPATPVQPRPLPVERGRSLTLRRDSPRDERH